MTNEEFISINREADIRSLALKKVPEGVDALWCLKQIEGYQISQKKLPLWANCTNLWYPPRISMEQCSSEHTAMYKRSVIQKLLPNKERNKLVDLTGGFGVDFSYIAQDFASAIYVEQQEELCRIATHNMPILGLPKAIVKHADSTCFLKTLKHADIIFVDPARRDSTGKKTIAIEDCTPDISILCTQLIEKSKYTAIKLSPMLDIKQALRTLKNICEIHVISVKGECKELFIIMSATHKGPTICHCVNLDTNDTPFSCDIDFDKRAQLLLPDTKMEGMFMFEPNASIQKAGMQDLFANKYHLKKLHPNSNLFVSKDIPNISSNQKPPARIFQIKEISDFSKASLKSIMHNERNGNITIRNFPSTVAELRKRLKLKEGGDKYYFATTLADNSHVLLKCQSFKKL